ncbi:MAG: class I SAM-dependent RNA methyltransferase [Acidimicrobiia bacterium]|nr:class I SAM-dependent RNA methyltransferase [Acidimicrobiia bacterium]
MSTRRAGRAATSRPAYRAAAICTPGLEFVCRQELLDLGCTPKSAGLGTVAFDATPRQLYAANVWLRTASRVIVRVATFRSTDFVHLERRAAEVDWSAWLADGVAPSFRISSHESRLYHTKAIAQRLHRVAGPPSTGEPEQLFIVRIDRNTLTVSVDASGAALHRRPWRTELGDAPLRTTMAAALLLAIGWNPETPLLDPFCGSGTIPIEAALLARRLPPGGDRSFAFADWPDFQPGAWASVTGEIAARAEPSCPAPITATDRSTAAIAAARVNAERAGVADDLELDARVVSHTPARSGTGLVATNPPYGKRVGDGNLIPLYRRFGAVVRERLPDWSLAMVCADRKLAKAADRGLAPVARFRHGGLPVQLLYRPGREAAEAGTAPARRARSQPAEQATRQAAQQIAPDGGSAAISDSGSGGRQRGSRDRSPRSRSSSRRSARAPR